RGGRRQVGGRGDVVDVDRGRVLGEAAVLVDDPRLDRVVGGTVEIGRASCRERGGGVGVGGTGEVAVRAAVGVVEVGVRVGRRRVGLVVDGVRPCGVLVDRGGRRQVGGRGDVVDVDRGRVLGEAAVLVDDPRLDRVVGGTV